MGELEQRVRELTAPAAARERSGLEAATGSEPRSGSWAEVNRVVMRALSGVHDALLEIATRIDEP